MIFDSHAHYDDKQFDIDRDELLSSMNSNGVGLIVNVASDLKSWSKTIELTEKYPFIYGTIGIHPSCKEDLSVESIEKISQYLKRDKIVAVGEIGLDYYWDKDNHKLQKEMFIKQLEIARNHNLPVVIHSREAAADTFNIVNNHGADLKGVMHCYSYSVEQAREYVKMGFYIGVGGVVTFSNGKKLKEVVAEIPLESILMETDCPYLAPMPYRGKRNVSEYLIHVAKEIGAIKGIHYKDVIKQTWENGKKLYEKANVG